MTFLAMVGALVLVVGVAEVISRLLDFAGRLEWESRLRGEK